ncbi:NB-ARC domain protein [Paraburkholderia xenovorans LB400]|uniref:Transcriptional regulator, winged helix family n=1 Tax=Paraburkholderia xenovorans (strain LB400) TaxID=266265 RepID=Q13QN0_PARXL|nr:winged helix-turn-helix domain-containing protein [Paraburkholderia xenovorans]ABE33609.1 transcriptional regulator, winged helix family [Paraburkholderia xenovorans LB400]AIP37807.1 NB-ARC domain protein [Paraburkholderia xenovorans LB400]
MMEIGRFQIDLEMRNLRRDGEVVRLGSRAFDILAVVASAAGRLVTKDELMNAVWPDTIVEENNIQVHLSALRKVLGPDRDLILTVPGRGYQLLQRKKNALPGEANSQVSLARRLPPPKSGLLPRAAEVELIRAMLRHAHVLTLAGAGGIGKTQLAIEAARHSAAQFADPVCFVELAALTTHESVLCAIAESCGLVLPGTQTDVTRVAAALAGKPRLLLLDNAEHVVGAVAQIADALVAGNERLRVLVTSREPLRIMAETVFRVDPLDVPPPDASDEEILACSAVNLFLLRANSLQETVATGSAELRLVGEICRRLDGMPLAIELAAARVVALGVEGVYRRLDDRMAILAGGYRTALPRHQTLRATFDWSFALLDPVTRAVFRRLALFSGTFCFESMCAVVCDEEHTMANAIGGITELVAKSLVSVQFVGAAAKYRLSESTRAYALEQLKAEGELREIVARNARYVSRCVQARLSGDRRDSENQAAGAHDLQPTLDDARVAFDWVFSADGDPRTGIELASNLADALLDAGLFEECCARAAQAVDALERQPSGTVSAASEQRVRAALDAASRAVREPLPALALTQRAPNPVPKKQEKHEPHEPHAPAVAAMAPPACFITT